jgi:general secretion pathway protein C
VLDNYFKHYFWTFHLVILGLAAMLMARTVNAFVAESLRVPPGALVAGRADDRPVQAQEHAAAVPTSALFERNVFKAEREDLMPVEPAPGEPGGPGGPTPVADLDRCQDKSTMRVNLVATIVASDSEASIAVFVDPTKNEPLAYRIGEKVLDEAQLRSVEWKRVKVDHGGRCEYFTIESEAEAPKPATPEVASLDNGDAPDMKIGQNVKKVSESEYEIPKAEIDNVLGNLNVIATQARIVPSFQNGKANGFKLFSIRPDSLYSKIGIHNGDVVQKINGYEMNSPDKALEIYSKLKDASNITVDIVRGGKTQTLSYNIR